MITYVYVIMHRVVLKLQLFLKCVLCTAIIALRPSYR